LPEELLASANFDRRLCFGRASRRDEPDFVALEEIHFLGFIKRE
jgi:hypothetical protein